MNVKILIAAITLILAACTAIYFWAEWEKARSRPFIDLPRAQVITPTSPPKQERDKTKEFWAFFWTDPTIGPPAADAPRPYKHLSDRELLRVIEAGELPHEELLQAHNEFYFRLPEEMREKLIRTEAELREKRARAAAAAKRIEEAFRQAPLPGTD